MLFPVLLIMSVYPAALVEPIHNPKLLLPLSTVEAKGLRQILKKNVSEACGLSMVVFVDRDVLYCSFSNVFPML